MSLDAFLGLMSAVIPAASAVSSGLNHVIREKTAAEVELPRWLLLVAAVLNLFSVNVDKAAQLAGMAKPKAEEPKAD